MAVVSREACPSTAATVGNRAVKDGAFAELRRQLEYKAGWHGRTVVAVERWFPSTKRCVACGHRHTGLRLAHRRWRCSAEHDRDVNAARNLEAEGLRILSQIHPEDTGGVRAPGGEGEGPAGTRPVAVPARIGRAA